MFSLCPSQVDSNARTLVSIDSGASPNSDNQFMNLPDDVHASNDNASICACIAGEAAAIRLEARLRGSSTFMDAVKNLPPQRA
jgi:hypothetical protein